MFMDDYKLKISSRYRDEMYNKFLGTNDINQVFEKINTCMFFDGQFILDIYAIIENFVRYTNHSLSISKNINTSKVKELKDDLILDLRGTILAKTYEFVRSQGIKLAFVDDCVFINDEAIADEADLFLNVFELDKMISTLSKNKNEIKGQSK